MHSSIKTQFTAIKSKADLLKGSPDSAVFWLIRGICCIKIYIFILWFVPEGLRHYRDSKMEILFYKNIRESQSKVFW